MAYVHVAHDCFVGNEVILANCVNLAGHITIEDNAILEGTVAVQQFVSIGKHSFVAGGSLVRKNVPPFIKAAREPLSYVGVNSIGLKRRGFDEATVKQIEDIYRLLYVMNDNTAKGIAAIENEIEQTETRTYILDFVAKSDKGIMRGKGV